MLSWRPIGGNGLRASTLGQNSADSQVGLSGWKHNLVEDQPTDQGEIPMPPTVDDAHRFVLSRRRAFGVLGGAGLLAAAAACAGPGAASSASSASSVGTGSGSGTAGSTGTAIPSCLLSPEMTEGPYYVSGGQVRSNIREDREGTPLTLEFTVSNALTCAVLQDAMVDIWHCDAVGDYSAFNSDNQTFLRGVQATDAVGLATFSTVYPGWYQGRATHIHLKVHISGQTIHTGQVFFDESLNDTVYATSPYDRKSGNRILNEQDGIYSDGGSASLLAVTQDGDGYLGAITVGVQLD